jgi:hypothetical protein
MNKTVKSSLAILKQEFGLQYITASFFLFFFAASMLWARYSSNQESELPKLLIILYTSTFGFVLPWQTNTKGHIAPEYCRYNLNMPVQTWQLIILPLLSRFLLIFFFVALEISIHGVLYGFLNGRYISLDNMIYYTKISILVYLVLQAFAWSKNSFKNLFLWLAIAFAVCTIKTPRIILRVFDNDRISIYYILIFLLLLLAAAGVSNLRKGLIFELPGLKVISDFLSRVKIGKYRAFTNAGKAHFYQEWKLSWSVMPAMTLATIVTFHIIAVRNNNYNFPRDLLNILTVFFITTVSAPIVGIIVNGKCFKSTYVNNLPINSRALAGVRLKSFCLSYAISLGIFLLWILHKIFIDEHLLEAIYTRNQIILDSPGVIIWLIITFIVWAFISAFIVISAVLKYRVYTFILLTAMIGYFLFHHQIIKYFHLYPNSVPIFPVLFCVVAVLVTVKLCMSKLPAKSFLTRLVVIFIIAGLTVLYTLFACKYTYMLILPLCLIFLYPLNALTQTIHTKRHEHYHGNFILSRRIMFTVMLIFLCFSLFIYFLNLKQKKELDKAIKQCQSSIIKPSPDPYLQPTRSLDNYVKQNMPYRNELLPKLEKFTKKKQSKYGHVTTGYTYGNILNFLYKNINDMFYSKKYEQALELTLFNLKTSIRYDRYHYNYLNRNIYKIPTKAKELLPKLKSIKLLLRKSAKYKINSNIRFLNDLVNLLKENSTKYNGTTFSLSSRKLYLFRLRTRKNNKTSNIPDFEQLFLSPLCLNDRINYTLTIHEVIKCVNYTLTGKNKPDLTKKIDINLISIYETYAYNMIISSLVAIAVTEYRIQNGKAPSSLQQLVPEYLQEHELYYINTSWYRHRKNHPFSPVLKASSMEKIKTFMRNQTLY